MYLTSVPICNIRCIYFAIKYSLIACFFISMREKTNNAYFKMLYCINNFSHIQNIHSIIELSKLYIRSLQKSRKSGNCFIFSLRHCDSFDAKNWQGLCKYIAVSWCKNAFD